VLSSRPDLQADCAGPEAATSKRTASRARGWAGLEQHHLRPRPEIAVAVAYASAMFVAGMDMQIVNVALPTLSREFAAPLSDVQWVAISYLLAMAVLIPASGWIGDRVGVKQTFVFALGLFTIASALCGAVHSLAELIAARTLQGAGGGMMAPSGMAMLYRAYPPERRARIARTVLVPILIGPAVAPVLGGALTEWFSWRWVFLVNVPVGITMTIFSLAFLPRTPATNSNRIDLFGLVLSGLGLSSLLYAISEGSTLGWGSFPVVLTGGGGVALLAAFGRWSLRHHDPILRLRLLGNRLFRSNNIVFALSTGPFLGSLYLTPIFLQEVMHQSPVTSGTTTFVEAIGVAIGAQTLVRLYPRCGPRPLATVGAGAVALYLGAFVWVRPETSLWFVRGLMFFGGFANSAAFLAVQISMFTTVSDRDLGHASAIYNTQRQSSIALNVAVVTTIAAGSAAPRIAAFHSAYLVAAAIAVAGTLCAFTLIRTEDARATMRVTK
jgi:EmrB/QacA subfamily drug resistance transporter